MTRNKPNPLTCYISSPLNYWHFNQPNNSFSLSLTSHKQTIALDFLAHTISLHNLWTKFWNKQWFRNTIKKITLQNIMKKVWPFLYENTLGKKFILQTFNQFWWMALLVSLFIFFNSLFSNWDFLRMQMNAAFRELVYLPMCCI